MDKDKISVFGATGFIGGNYCDIFSDEIFKVPRDKCSTETNNVLYFISTVDNYNVFTDPYVDIETNLIHLIKVLENCKDKKDLVFNYISSWFVYGKTNDIPAREDSICNPLGFYSITKYTSEQLLISYCETFGINYRILRLCNVYGETDEKVSKKRNALQHMIGELAKDRDISLYDGGENIRDFMYVEDVCRAVKFCMEKAPLNEVINIGSGNPYKFKDLMAYAKKSLDSKGNLNSCEPPDFHKTVQVQDMYLDTTKLKKIGFSPKYNIWQGLDKIIANVRD